jgi:hypothetical protein
MVSASFNSCTFLLPALPALTRVLLLVCRLQAVCVGCSGTVKNLDWSYALVHGPVEMLGRYILQSNDTSREVLHWDGLTGKKISGNQRDCLWSTWTCKLGFPVLGIWPDYSDGKGLDHSDDRMATLHFLLFVFLSLDEK